MNTRYSSLRFFVCTLLLASLALVACDKDDDIITDKVSLEEYINSTGHDLEITTYFNGSQKKTFIFKRDSLVSISNPMDPGTDSTGTIFRADSAKMIFDDGKMHMMRDTIKTNLNFLNSTNFTTAVSPSGKTHYFRYTFSAAHYQLAR